MFMLFYIYMLMLFFEFLLFFKIQTVWIILKSVNNNYGCDNGVDNGNDNGNDKNIFV